MNRSPQSFSETTLPVVPRILIGDNPESSDLIGEYLSRHGMRTAFARDPATLFEKIEEHPSLVVMDLSLGEVDGLELLRRIRSASDVPIVLVTEHHLDEIDRIIGLELGADDFLIKPFPLRELLARIRNILRRRTKAAEHRYERPRSRVRFGPWELNRMSRRIHREGLDDPIALTKGEYALLEAFLRAPQRPLSREHLLRATRVHEDVYDRSVDVQVLRLRRKLQEGPDTPEIIETIRGVGYVFRAAAEVL